MTRTEAHEEQATIERLRYIRLMDTTLAPWPRFAQLHQDDHQIQLLHIEHLASLLVTHPISSNGSPFRGVARQLI